MISTAQIRAARAIIGWKQSKLAEACGLSLTGLNNIERGTSSPRVCNLSSIQKALEKAGVIFVPADEFGAGVRLRDRDIKA